MGRFCEKHAIKEPIRSPCTPYAEARKRLIDGRLLGTGAANFSASGHKRQNNDSIVIESAEAAGAFKRAFDAQFASREALVAGAKEWALTFLLLIESFDASCAETVSIALATLQQGIDHIGDFFEFGCE
jgi:hypothetical protein